MSYVKKRDGLYYIPKLGRVMEHTGHAMRIHWSRQMLDDLRRMFPTTLNEEMAGYLGVSQSAMSRKARQLGLKKDPKWLAEIWEQRRVWAQIANETKGYPGGFKKGGHACQRCEYKPGHRLSEEAAAKKAAAQRRYNRLNPDKVRARVLKAIETKRRKKLAND